MGTARGGRPPEPGIEATVAEAFSRLLGCEVNDIEADFFALGGHSLLAMRLAAQQPRAGTSGDARAGDGGLDGGETERAAGVRSQ